MARLHSVKTRESL